MRKRYIVTTVFTFIIVYVLLVIYVLNLEPNREGIVSSNWLSKIVSSRGKYLVMIDDKYGCKTSLDIYNLCKTQLNNTFYPPLYAINEDCLNECNFYTILYTVVPYSLGAVTFSLLKSLTSTNNFNAVSKENLIMKSKFGSEQNEQVRLGEEMNTYQMPSIYYSELNYIQFLYMGIRQPVYIAMVSNPINSYLAYVYQQMLSSHLDTNNVLYDCILNQHQQCTYPKALSLISYFCEEGGNSKKINKISLESAKQNIANNYLLIGVTEEYETSLTLMEIFLPRIFRGVVNRYRTSPYHKVIKNYIGISNNISTETISVIMKWMELDMELYDYIYERFSNLKYLCYL